MADIRISELLPALNAISGDELVPIVQNGLTVRTTVSAITQSPSQTQTFLTVGLQSTLPNSRYFSTGTGIGITDGGSLGAYTIRLNGTSGSLESAATGIVAKTAANVITSRTLTVSGNGISVTNGDGIAGDPTFALTGLALALANASGTGLLSINGSALSPLTLTGTTNQIDITNGNGAGGNPVVAIASNPVISGSGGMVVPVGNTAARPALPANGTLRYNSQIGNFEGYANGVWTSVYTGAGVTSVATGTGLTGGPITTTGTISIANTGVSAGTYGSALSIPQITVNAQGQITSVTTVASGAVAYQGTWNASTNTPTLTSSVGTAGYYYIVSVAGTTNLNGEALWGVGDWAVFNGSTWQKVEGGDTINATTGTFSGQLNLTNASNYNLYASGAGANYMAGNLAVGSTMLLSLAGISSNTNILAATYFWNRIPSSQSVATRGLLFTIDGIDYGRIYAPNGSSVAIQTGSGTLSDYLTINQSGVTSIGGTVGSESLRVTPVASAVNYWNFAGRATGAAPYVQAEGSDTNIDLLYATKGTGSHVFYTAGYSFTPQFKITNTASAVNYFQVNGGATSSSPYLSAQGTDANIHSQYLSKGTYGHIFNTGSTGNFQFYVAHTASAVNYLQATGNTTGSAPYLSAQGSDTNINLGFLTKGTGGYDFWTGGNFTRQFAVAHTASAVNYLQVSGNTTGGGPAISAQGSDTNVNLNFFTKGSGYSYFYNGSVNPQFAIGSTSPAVNYLLALGNITGFGPSLTATGTDTNIPIYMIAKGASPIYFIGQSNNTQFAVNMTAAAVNYGTVAGGATGNAVTFAAQGTDTNVTMNLMPQGNGVVKVNTTTALTLAIGTTAQRPTAATGQVRFNSDTVQFEGYNGTAWGALGGGNTTTNGLWENAIVIAANYTIGTGNNAISAGPITINSGVTVTIPSGSVWTIT